MIEVFVKKLRDTAIPSYATQGSNAVDLCVVTNGTEIIYPGCRKRFGTGLAFSIPKGYAGIIVPRSGLGSKGIVLSNLVGVIDSDYRGEVMLDLWNRGDIDSIPVEIKNGMRVAQMIIVPVPQALFTPVDILDDTSRGDNGFGSTGHY